MINYDLSKIKAVIFDVDGVLLAETIPMDDNGMPLRTVNIKDGYAIQLAHKVGLRIVLLTGGTSEALRKRYEYLGVEDIYMGASVKVAVLEQIAEKYGYDMSELIYVGDDVPDYEVMRRVGCPCCPADACQDIKSISVYISDKRGGYGCGRDIIEQVLRVQGKWMSDARAFGW